MSDVKKLESEKTKIFERNANERQRKKKICEGKALNVSQSLGRDMHNSPYLSSNTRRVNGVSL